MKSFVVLLAPTAGCSPLKRTFPPKITVSSNDEGVAVNDDGSIDLYLAPRPAKGFEANTVITNPDDNYFLMFRSTVPSRSSGNGTGGLATQSSQTDFPCDAIWIDSGAQSTEGIGSFKK